MKHKWFVCYFFIVFLVGWWAHSLYANNFVDFSNTLPSAYKTLEQLDQTGNKLVNAGNQNPSSPAKTKGDSLLVRFFAGDNERYSPEDRIKEEQIHVYKDKIIIDLKDASWSSFVDTNSMDPVLDKGTNGIEVMPTSPSDIKVGDVISYEYKDNIIAHRVVKIGLDEKGIYYITKGDNNVIKDPKKVRFEQVKGVLVGLIY